MEKLFTNKFQKFWSENWTSLNSILGVLLGMIAGLIVKAIFWPGGQQVDPNFIRYLSLPGLLFIRAFLLLIIPLLITSISTCFFSNHQNTISSDKQTEEIVFQIPAKKLLLVTFVFFISFSTFTTFLGISMITAFKPGASRDVAQIITKIEVNESMSDISIAQKHIEQINLQTDSVYNIIMNIFPDNLISITFMTFFTTSEVVWPANLTQILDPNFVPSLRLKNSHTFKPNMLGLCAISLLLGMLLQKIGPNKSESIRKLLFEVEFLVRKSMTVLLKLMPAGMFFWMFTETLKMHSLTTVGLQLVYFYTISLSAYAIVLLLFYPVIYFVCTRENPFTLYKTISSAILVAIGSCSSAIALPLTMECMQEKGGLSKSIANSVLPLGMTLHMNGTAMYYPMVALFVAQMKQVEVDTFSIILLGICAIIMSMGLPASPSGGSVIVNHITFASVIGIDNPIDVLTYIMAFEWFMERVRTPFNVIGDCIASKCIQKFILPNRLNLEKLEMDKEKEVSKC